MLKKTLLAAAVFVCATTAVQANEVSGYLTVSVGQAKAEKPKVVKEEQGFFKELGGSTSSDRTDTAHKIAVGLKVNPYIALEAQYIDLGKASYKGSSSAPGFGSYSEKIDFKTSGLGANLVGTLPLDDFTLFAKVGYHYLKTKGSLKETASFAGVGSFSESGSDNVRKWTPSFGIGASYAITQELAVVAEYERYQDVANKKVNVYGDKTSFKHDIDFASVGLRYNF